MDKKAKLAKYVLLDTNNLFRFHYDKVRDRVVLMKYNDNAYNGEVVIPNFVDDIEVNCFSGVDNLKKVICENPPKDCSSLFASLGAGVTRLDMTDFNVENVEDMSNMFSACTHLTSVSVYNWDTRNVKNMSYMFASNYHMEYLDLSSFKTPSVVNLDCMFYRCENLREIYLTGMTAENVLSMRKTFGQCYMLRQIHWGNFEPKQTLILYNTFDECAYLKEENKLFCS